MDTHYTLTLPKRRDPDGFTLAELVVASTLVALVMASVYTIFSTAVQAWRGGESDMAVYHDARIALSRMSQELRSIEESAWFQVLGTEDSIEFCTLTVPMAVEEGLGERLMWVRYHLKGSRDRDGATLIREEAIIEGGLPIDSERPDLGRKYEFEVVQGVRMFELSYIWLLRPIRYPPGSPPPYVEPIIEKVNKKKFGLPQGIGIRLSVAGEGRELTSSPVVFNFPIVFRGSSSPLPQELHDRYVGRAG